MKRLFLMFAMIAALGFAACGDEDTPAPAETDAQADTSTAEDTSPPEGDGTAADTGPSTPGLPDISVPSTDTGGPGVPDGGTG
ncbi:MAG: hypothetical protein VYE15_06400, partial [Myxococcota bacterium]|nr:hypothetical protein [Myxococcota bacterium]